MAWCLCLEGKHVDIRLPTKILLIVFVFAANLLSMVFLLCLCEMFTNVHLLWPLTRWDPQSAGQ